nr:hypothetical protein [Mycobacterium sp. 852013-50091_SCH5140682]
MPASHNMIKEPPGQTELAFLGPQPLHLLGDDLRTPGPTTVEQ